MPRRARCQAVSSIIKRIDVSDPFVDVAQRAPIAASDNQIAGDWVEDLGRAELVGLNRVCRGEVHPGLGIPNVVNLGALLAVLRPSQMSGRGRPAIALHGSR